MYKDKLIYMESSLQTEFQTYVWKKDKHKLSKY